MLALKNAVIETVSRGRIEHGTVLIDAGKIAACGQDLPVPEGAQVYDCTGKWITPGFIDAHTHISTANFPNVNNLNLDLNEKSSPVTPALRVEDSLNPRDLAIAKTRQAGFTTVCSLPGSTNVFGGTGICFKLHEAAAAEQMIIPGTQQFKIALGENPKIYHGGKGTAPMTRMAVAAMLREWFTKARDYAQAKETAMQKGDAFREDFQLEPFLPVLSRKVKLRAHCHRSDDILTAIKIAEEFDLDISVEHVTEGYLIADYLKTKKADFVLGPLVMDPVKLETQNISLKNPAIMEQAGIRFSMMQDCGINTYLLPVYIGMCMAFGLSEKAAMESVTVNPARLLKLEDRMGTVDVGKDADLAVWTGHPFSNFTICEATLIDGVMYPRASSSVLY